MVQVFTAMDARLQAKIVLGIMHQQRDPKLLEQTLEGPLERLLGAAMDGVSPLETQGAESAVCRESRRGSTAITTQPLHNKQASLCSIHRMISTG